MITIDILENVSVCKTAWGDRSLPDKIKINLTDTLDYVAMAEYVGGRFGVSYSKPFIFALDTASPTRIDMLLREITIHELCHLAQYIRNPQNGMKHNAEFRKLMRLVGYNPERASLVCTTFKNGEKYISGTDILADDLVKIAIGIYLESRREEESARKAVLFC